MQFADASWAHGGPKLTSRTTDADAVVDQSAESGQSPARGESTAQLRDVLISVRNADVLTAHNTGWGGTLALEPGGTRRSW